MLYTSNQAAEILGINRPTVSKWVKMGWIKSVTDRNSRIKLFTMEQIEEAKKANPIPIRKGFIKGRPKAEVLAERQQSARRTSIRRDPPTPVVESYKTNGYEPKLFPFLKPYFERIEKKLDIILKELGIPTN